MSVVGITIAGVTIKPPSTFNPEYYPLTKGGRTTDGTMQLDFLANKIKLTFKYAAIAGGDLHPIMAALLANLFMTVTIPDQGGSTSITCYRAKLALGNLVSQAGTWMYKDVEIDLIQQ